MISVIGITQDVIQEVILILDLYKKMKILRKEKLQKLQKI